MHPIKPHTCSVFDNRSPRLWHRVINIFVGQTSISAGPLHTKLLFPKKKKLLFYIANNVPPAWNGLPSVHTHKPPSSFKSWLRYGLFPQVWSQISSLIISYNKWGGPAFNFIDHLQSGLFISLYPHQMLRHLHEEDPLFPTLSSVHSYKCESSVKNVTICWNDSRHITRMSVSYLQIWT